jgi:hypothetical protein
MGMTGTEQRQYPRHRYEDEFYCYLDGSRFDARSLDISAGGLFLKTQQEVPAGASIALVFKDQKDPSAAPVFLVGEVMRRQEVPVPGIGLRWHRAVTEGTAARLEIFLTLRMGLLPGPIASEPHGVRGGMRHVYYFARPPHSEKLGPNYPVQPQRKPSSSPPPSPSFAAGRPAGKAVPLGVQVDIVRTDGRREDRGAAPLPDHVQRLSTGSSGPLSMILRRGDTLAPARLAATARLPRGEVACEIAGLSVKSMFLTGVGRLPSHLSDLQVAFELPAREGTVPVVCDCRLLYVTDEDEENRAGVELEIIRYDEGAHKGILWTYLKWLTFRQLKGEGRSPAAQAR